MTDADWDELVSLPDRKAKIAWLRKKCLENDPNWDPDDDTVMLAGDPEKVERVVRELSHKKGGD